MTHCLPHFPWAIGSTPSGRLRAQRYAYHFFFRRMIELPGFRRAQIQGAPYEIVAPQPLSAFKPGASAALDSVCDGILRGTPFVFDENLS